MGKMIKLIISLSIVFCTIGATTLKIYASSPRHGGTLIFGAEGDLP